MGGLNSYKSFHKSGISQTTFDDKVVVSFAFTRGTDGPSVGFVIQRNAKLYTLMYCCRFGYSKECSVSLYCTSYGVWSNPVDKGWKKGSTKLGSYYSFLNLFKILGLWVWTNTFRLQFCWERVDIILSEQWMKIVGNLKNVTWMTYSLRQYEFQLYMYD